MTKVILQIKDNGDLFYECMNHAGDHDVCTIMSTISNFLVEECFECGCEPTVYDKGHVRIDMSNAGELAKEIFRIAEKQISRLKAQNPEHIKVY